MSAKSFRCLVPFLTLVCLVTPRVSGAQKEASPAKDLFDGKSLAGWQSSEFDGGGAVKVVNPFQDGRAAIVVEAGAFLSGFSWTDEAALPRINYEISLEAMRL